MTISMKQEAKDPRSFKFKLGYEAAKLVSDQDVHRG